MPNYILNHIRFSKPSKEAIGYITNMDSLLPTPANLKDSERINSWRAFNWGSTAFAPLIEHDIDIANDNTSIKYTSKWSHHEAFIKKLSHALPEIEFEVKWIQEFLPVFEHYVIQNGVKHVITNSDMLLDEQDILNFMFQEDLWGHVARQEWEAEHT